MRRFVSTTMILAASAIATPAFSSSIVQIGGTSAAQSSIVSVACGQCPPPASKEDKGAYKVPSLPAGSQTTEVVEVNGEKKLKRVENWFGGSPVVFVTSAQGWSTTGTMIAAGAAHPPAGIDREATTAAIADAAPVVTMPEGPIDFDRAGFDLRLK